MKTNVILIILTISLIAFIGCNKNENIIETTTLSAKEKSDLLHLREEEKLARDVYLYAFNKYGQNVFKNISNSEQLHMDKVLQILTTHNIADPANPQQGVFNNEELQNLYNSLTQKVDISLLEALLVGATIEDLDIKDIDEFKANTSNQSILNMYDNLECGSRNHLRAYYSNVKNQGGDYTPQYISQDYFEEIINGEHENCGNGNGGNGRNRKNH